MSLSSRKAGPRIAGALAAAALFAVFAGPAVAQIKPQTEPAAPAAPSPLPALPTLKLTTQEEYVIREVLLTDANAPKESSAPENIGDTVPDSVELHPMPPEVAQKVPKVKSHRFFIKGDTLYLVSPSDRRIADVLKKKSTD